MITVIFAGAVLGSLLVLAFLIGDIDGGTPVGLVLSSAVALAALSGAVLGRLL